MSSLQMKELDEVYLYLQTHEIQPLGDNEIPGLPMLRRKVDQHIIPVMFLCYAMQFLDKVLLNYAGVMGLKEDLQLRGNQFSNASSFFYVAYVIAEIPMGLILNRVPASKWLAANVILWGITTVCTAGTSGYHSLLATRIVLGIFEASIGPCLMLITSQWYNKSEQAPRFAFWYLGVGCAQIIGSLVSFGFQHVSAAEISSWRIMFIVLGLTTIAIGLASLFLVPDSPISARFLSQNETIVLLKHVAANRTGVVNHYIRLDHLLELVMDIQLWLMCIMTTSLSVTSGVITTYSATLLNNLGFTSKEAALLNAPSGIISIIAAVVSGLVVRRTSNRWICIIVCIVPAIIGGGLMSFMPQDSKAGLLSGIYLVNTVTATLPIIYQWTSSNVAGSTKRCFSVALVSGSYGIGNIIGPQTFQARDAPQYIPAKIAILATLSGGALLSTLLFLLYRYRNRARNNVAITSVHQPPTEVDSWTNITDQKDPAFVYVY